MSNNEINKEAYKQAEKELMEGKVKHIKGFILETLQKIENKKKEKEKIEEELRILKLDLDDLRNGNFEKIEDRIDKSKVARGISIDFPRLVDTVFTNHPGFTTSFIPNWSNLTSGTYTVNCSTGTKTFYF